ncbi:hypothetical protein ACFFGV_17585 [Pontibacillus salicampi]|uniref:Uncharacterized protein n=1 Tax=Pontibacillus salicampi TaxID=1449801 RepID=A0ABV6LSK0_9BACI
MEHMTQETLRTILATLIEKAEDSTFTNTEELMKQLISDLTATRVRT